MTTTFLQGDLLQSDAAALVNPVNCVGVMGAGLALDFKARFPSMFERYRDECRRNLITLGKMHVYKASKHLIINFPTKRHWREGSSIGAIKDGLVDLVRVVREREIPSVAIPQLGCGLGGLAWEDVRPLIAEAFADARAVDVRIYECPVTG